MTGSFSPARNRFMPLRVIAGQLRGKKLVTVPGRETRPTADRTRESIFNILGTAVRHAHVLDLFAGTGAFGIEALSRGADFALFIENGQEALGVLNRNIQSCRLADRARVLCWDAAGNLKGLADGDRKFDLVFLDPPYGAGMIAPALRHLADSRCLALSPAGSPPLRQNACVVFDMCAMSRASDPPATCGLCALTRRRPLNGTHRHLSRLV